eukprot:6182325-Pleurochrysis_carterae.AAC.1
MSTQPSEDVHVSLGTARSSHARRHLHLPEFGGGADGLHDVGLGAVGVPELREGLHRGDRDVEMGSRASELGRVERSRGRVEAQHLALVEPLRHGAHQFSPPAQQPRVGVLLLKRDAVGERVSAHAHVEVGVREPDHRLAHRRDRAERNLRVQVVAQHRDELALNGGLQAWGRTKSCATPCCPYPTVAPWHIDSSASHIDSSASPRRFQCAKRWRDGAECGGLRLNESTPARAVVLSRRRVPTRAKQLNFLAREQRANQ